MSETPSKPIVTTASLPANEVERLEALRRYNILDTPPEAAFDRITSLAARLFNVPMALVFLIDESRGWFKSAYGLDMREVQRDASICSLGLLSKEVVVILDIKQNHPLASNPLVHNKPDLRFYAGAPLLTPDGLNLGTVCLLDTQPRDAFTNEQKVLLADLAAMVMDELELRLATHKIAQIDAALLEVSGGLGAVTGEAFFFALVQYVSKVLEVDYTYIGLVDGDDRQAIRTMATCAKGQIIDNFRYLLDNTPCQEVLRQRKLCCYPNRVRALFPNAPFLERFKIESYVAVPFFDTTGLPLGLLGVMDTKPLTNVQLAEFLLSIFALRIAAELEQQQTEAVRQQAQYELQRLVEQRTAELSQANELLYLEIAERQQAEAALEKEQELLRVLLDNVQAGIVACNAQGILTLFNRAAREFHGLPEQPLPPEQWAQYYDLYLPDGKTRMSKNEIPLFRALQGEIVENVEMVIAPKQGKVKTLLASGQAIWDSQGKKLAAVVVMHDITERKLAEAELLISDVALRQMPDAVFLTDLEGKIQRWLGNAEQIFGYTAKEAIAKPMNFLYPSDMKTAIMAKIMQSIQATGDFCGEIPCFRKDGSPVHIETTAKTVSDKAGNPIFLICINKDISERKQAEAERAQLMRQQVQEQTARKEAEADQQRSAFLAEISTALASSLDYELTLASVANLVVPFFADWCVIDLLEDNQFIHQVAVAHRDRTKVALAWAINQQYPRQIDASQAVGRVLRTGKTEIAAEIPDAALVVAAQDAEHLGILRQLRLKSGIISPLIARGQILGAISFITDQNHRRYTQADLALAEDIAHRAAIAIDNARLYLEAQQSQKAATRSAERITLLQSVTAAFSESLTPLQVADVIVDRGIVALGANFGMIALLNDTGTELEVLRTVGCEPDQINAWQRFSLNEPVPLAEAVRTGQPIWAEPSQTRAIRYPHLSQQYKEYNFHAWISIPLMVEGRAVGGMSFGFIEPQQLDEEQRVFILSLAQQCAQAIVRTRLYEAERTARSAAETANRVKDEFLAVLSHELRTPLNPILGWSRLLQSQKLDSAKTTEALKTIERNAKLQAQLIEDLLDVSRILQGKLNLDVTPVDLTLIISDAMATVRLAAEAKSIKIQTMLQPNVGQIAGDANRLQQIVWNLLTNAIKFTPSSGQVEIKLEQCQGLAEITVSDNGKGIPSQFLPYVFDYFRQADSTTTRKFGGLGLGLAIVRRLVELHGGTVEAQSPGEGLGATFVVKLPLMLTQRTINQDVSQTEQTLDLSGIKILIVDDDTDSREFVAFVLEQSGANVMMADSAMAGLKMLGDFQPDVLLSDIGMPQIDGYMFVQQVRNLPPEQGGNIIAIALTAYAGEINEKQAIAAGFHCHISKPMEPEELIETIAKFLKN
ncbi:diguanylate cyclase [Nostoc linckia z18]|uniref:Circadian input-output histidine kinase CikA n=2 Tax=Nostoc linckia TaxID=92942 RepID=A0A9Q6EIX3_NOSLI|nr:GAF domain-containing protein [Nostoc linckia]PHK27178.1 diguanylate cyclase [Nostoc linckia z15]PHK43594.1 diguanylate cyclase [Nostoc linckia z16]PHJ56283.1 diguanylate cyclase [Nostoc linckia z1]PHJ58439.1 diguanylate cyclase [Nostoc linckia z3]PHJ60423.1 diguanylate cyclase [Nostoc linckia z2]